MRDKTNFEALKQQFVPFFYFSHTVFGAPDVIQSQADDKSFWALLIAQMKLKVISSFEKPLLIVIKWSNFVGLIEVPQSLRNHAEVTILSFLVLLMDQGVNRYIQAVVIWEQISF